MGNKGILPANYLGKKGGVWKPVPLLDLLTLLHAICEGAKSPEVGFEDANQTFDGLVSRLNKKVLIDPALIESALWSANLMDEQGKFWDPKGRTFEGFLRDICGAMEVRGFNRTYNLFERKE